MCIYSDNEAGMFDHVCIIFHLTHTQLQQYLKKAESSLRNQQVNLHTSSKVIANPYFYKFTAAIANQLRNVLTALLHIYVVIKIMGIGSQLPYVSWRGGGIFSMFRKILPTHFVSTENSKLSYSNNPIPSLTYRGCQLSKTRCQ